MRNKVACFVSLLVLVFLVPSCNTGTQDSETIIGTGSTVEQDREVGSISAVDLAMNGNLHISMGDTTSLRIEAQDNLMQYIQTDTEGHTLVIHTPPGINVEGTRPIQYYLTVEKLNSLHIASSGDIETGDLKADSFSVQIESSGDVTIDSLESPALEVKIASSGDLKISSGQIQKQTIHITSSGKYNGRDVQSANATVNLTSSGPATVWVSEHLSGQLSSSGNIYYVGDPEINIRTTSSGKVVQID